MSDAYSFLLNGRPEHVVGVDVHTTLLSYLRSRGLTGSKESCAEGECGACAVVMIGRDERGAARLEPVNACLVLLPAAAGREVWTVEGVAATVHASPAAHDAGVAGRTDDAGGTRAAGCTDVAFLHPVQRAIVEVGASQCGYCTPGFVMSLLARYHGERREPAVHALSGNLCRCTGYRPLRDVAERLPLPADDDILSDRLTRPVPDLERLHYVHEGTVFWRPTTLSEVLALRERHPAAPLLSGGTDLIVALNQDGASHSGWIALDGVEVLRTLRRDGDDWVIGAALPLADVERRLGGAVPLLDALWPLFASPLIRARATLGGNLATASPVGDAAPVLLALDASVDLAGVGGTRRLPLDAFFTGYRRTAMAADEIVEAVRVPALPPTHARFYKVTKRPLDDIASVSAAFAVHVERGQVARARLAYGGVAPTPARAYEAEAALTGVRWGDAAALSRVRQLLDAAFTPIDDHRASAAYRREMVVRLFEKFWSECAEAAA